VTVPAADPGRGVTNPDPAAPDDQPPTGTVDLEYDLILLLQQALADCLRYQRFAEDAEASGEDELASWLRELADADRDIAERAKRELQARWTAAAN
jgi:hypothetical protein